MDSKTYQLMKLHLSDAADIVDSFLIKKYQKEHHDKFYPETLFYRHWFIHDKDKKKIWIGHPWGPIGYTS